MAAADPATSSLQTRRDYGRSVRFSYFMPLAQYLDKNSTNLLLQFTIEQAFSFRSSNKCHGVNVNGERHFIHRLLTGP